VKVSFATKRNGHRLVQVAAGNETVPEFQRLPFQEARHCTGEMVAGVYSRLPSMNMNVRAIVGGSNDYGASSSISREFVGVQQESKDGPLSVQSVSLGGWAFAGLAIACFVAAMLVGIAIDVIVRYINQPLQSEQSLGRNDTSISSRRQRNSRQRRNSLCRQGEENAMPFEADTSFSSYSGVWGMRALSITNGASSIGFPMYRDVEDGCVHVNEAKASHVDLSDISDPAIRFTS
jgi:hypothetical protein